MQTNHKYFISIDIDGTIIKHDGTVTNKTKQMIHKLNKQGHIIVIATGRRYSHALPIYEALSLHTPIITESGAKIDHPKDQSFEPFQVTFDIELLKSFLEMTKTFMRSVFYTVDDVSYAFQFDQNMIMDTSGLYVEHANDIQLKEQPLPYGMMVYINEVNHQNFIDTIELHFSHKIGLRSWGQKNKIFVYEVYLKHISKASAVQYLLDLYNIPKTQWMSFGDSSNDIEMLAQAKYGIAMKNAETSVQTHASDITTHSNEEDGVALYLMNFFNDTLD